MILWSCSRRLPLLTAADRRSMLLLLIRDAQATELYDASPNLSPWRVKGRLHVKVNAPPPVPDATLADSVTDPSSSRNGYSLQLRQLLKDAQGGEAASKRWDIELKPTRAKGSPKKQQ